MVIDASLKFEEKVWRRNVEETIRAFQSNEIDLDTFIADMLDLGYDNALTRSLTDAE